jgi:haloacetate dehalogenase
VQEAAAMLEGFERHLIPVEGIDIACVTAGKGTSALLLHRFPQTMAIWAEIAPALIVEEYRVVCTDLRGFLASVIPRSQRTGSC